MTATEVARSVIDAPRGRPAWWFAPPGQRPRGVERVSVEPVPGRAGLHGATGPLAALAFAKSATLCRVQLDGVIVEADEQLAAPERRVMWCVDATEPLRALAQTWIVEVLASAAETSELKSPSVHRDRAGDARERSIQAEQRIRDAEWVLSEGAARATVEAKARAEGELSGARRAAAELRAVALAHEAAAALLGGDRIQDLGRAIERVTQAKAALRAEADPDEALRDARAALEEVAIGALREAANGEAIGPGIDAVAGDVAPMVAELEARTPESTDEGSHAEPPSAPLAPLDPPRGTPSLLAPAGLGPVLRIVDALPPPADEAPVAAGLRVLERLGQLPFSDESVRGVHPLVLTAPCWDAHRDALRPVLVVRHTSEGAEEQLRELERDPVFKAAGIDFLVTWELGAARSVQIGRFGTSRGLRFVGPRAAPAMGWSAKPPSRPLRAELVHAVEESRSHRIETSVDGVVRAELVQVPSVRAAGWIRDARRAQALAVWIERREDLPTVLSRVARARGQCEVAAYVGEDLLGAFSVEVMASPGLARFYEGANPAAARSELASELIEALVRRPFYQRGFALAEPQSRIGGRRPFGTSPGVPALSDLSSARGALTLLRSLLAVTPGVRAAHLLRTDEPRQIPILLVADGDRSELADRLLDSDEPWLGYAFHVVDEDREPDEVTVVDVLGATTGVADPALRTAIRAARAQPSLLEWSDAPCADAFEVALRIALRRAPGLRAAAYLPDARATEEPWTRTVVTWWEGARPAPSDDLERLFPTLGWLYLRDGDFAEEHFPEGDERGRGQVVGMAPATLTETLRRARGGRLLFERPPPVRRATSVPERRAPTVSAWTSALATAIERAMPASGTVRCPGCGAVYRLPPGTPLDTTRCGLCDSRGLLGETAPRPVRPPPTSRHRCPACEAPFRMGLAGATHARCPTCARAIQPVPVESVAT